MKFGQNMPSFPGNIGIFPYSRDLWTALKIRAICHKEKNKFNDVQMNASQGFWKLNVGRGTVSMSYSSIFIKNLLCWASEKCLTKQPSLQEKFLDPLTPQSVSVMLFTVIQTPSKYWGSFLQNPSSRLHLKFSQYPKHFQNSFWSILLVDCFNWPLKIS